MKIKLHKKIIKHGDSLAILIDKGDRDLYNLAIGDVVYIEIEKDIDWIEMNKRVQENK